MDIFTIIMLIAAGLAGGFINSFSAAGSLFTLPVLLFSGLPANVANGTNRIGILFQNIAAVIGYKTKGIPITKNALLLSAIAAAGAVIGANCAIDISPEFFRRFLGTVIILFLILLIFDPFKKNEVKVTGDNKLLWLNAIVFFGAGVYGGFIQAGTGFIMMFGCMVIQRMPLPQTNIIKVLAMFSYTIPSLYIFYTNGLVDIPKGLLVALGMATGSFIGSRWSVSTNQNWVKGIVMSFLVFFAIKLWFF